jgi:hypothetical protein
MRFLIPIFVLGCSEYEVGKVEESLSAPSSAPDIDVSPVFVDFGSQPEGGEPVSLVVTVQNLGDAPLDIMDVSLTDASGPYTVTAIDDATLLARETTSLVVEYIASEPGIHRDQLVIASNDPDEPKVPVELQGSTVSGDDPDPSGTPDLLAHPGVHDFGVMATTESGSALFRLTNVGDAALTIDDLRFDTESSEMALDLRTDINGSLPWALEPDETRSISVSYAPVDDVLDVGRVIVASNDPDTPETILLATGNGRTFEGFSAGWYIYDDGLDHETTSSPEHSVSTHGDPDLYWYEPSGAHGLVGSTDPETDFAIMRDYVMAGAGAPTEVSGPLSFTSSSHLSTFAFATFTYVMCDFWIEPTEDPASYTVSADTVDDGIQVMVNGEILGHMLLGASPTSWSLSDVGRPGEVNTLIVILVDDSASHRYLTNLAFFKDGVMVE